MLRSYIFKDRRVRAEVLENGPPSDAAIITIPEDHHETQGPTNISCPGVSRQAEESSIELGNCVNLECSSESVGVNLSAQCQESIEEDASKVEEPERITEMNDHTEGCTQSTEASASSSHSHEEHLSKKDSYLGLHEKQSQQHDVSVSIQVSASQQIASELFKNQERVFPRTVSAVSTDSLAECCRICQQTSDEPLIELGCHCRGELAKAHRKCIEQWFNNKGTNKCEVCRHTATNLQAPASQPLHNFWAWRLSRRYQTLPRWQGRGRFHPLLAALLILVAGLLFDVLISYYLGASALPVNIIIGVLVVLGLGTAARLIVECCQERRIRRSIQRMEADADRDYLRQQQLQNQQNQQ